MKRAKATFAAAVLVVSLLATSTASARSPERDDPYFSCKPVFLFPGVKIQFCKWFLF